MENILDRSFVLHFALKSSNSERNIVEHLIRHRRGSISFRELSKSHEFDWTVLLSDLSHGQRLP